MRANSMNRARPARKGTGHCAGRALVLFVGLLAASCANVPRDYRTAASVGTARHPLAPPDRLTIGREMSVPSPSGSGQRHPAVAYGDGVYLLVWREGFDGYKGNSNILAMRIGTDGAPLDREPIPVCVNPGVQHRPSVAFCAGDFMVTWAPKPEPGDTSGLFPLRTRRVGSDGALNPLTHSMFGERLKTWPAIASNGKDAFLLVWQEYVGDHFAVRGTRISAATDDWLDAPHLEIMSRTEELGTRWAAGGAIGVAWTGNGYLVCQSDFATYLAPDGKPLLPLTKTWGVRGGSGGQTAVAAWGKAFLFVSASPNPSAWGRGATGAIIGTTVDRSGARRERDAFLRLMPNANKHRPPMLIADDCAVNCIDTAHWFNHHGWPGGMHGGLKHTMGDLWPSGPPAAAFNGRSLVVVWPKGHLADNRRLFNRDLYLMRLLPGWAAVDADPVPVAAAPTEENHPVMCAGSVGQTLLAYERLTEDGPRVCYRLLSEAPDRTAPRVIRVMPKSRTELVVTFDEPLDEAGTDDPARFRVEGLTVTGAELSPDGRSKRRDVILTTAPPEVGRKYVLHVRGISDRSPAHNTGADVTFIFLAKPGFMQRSDCIYQWDNPRSTEMNYPNPDRIGARNYICSWSLLGPLPRDPEAHPFDPADLWPSPGDEVAVDGTVLTWKAAEGEVIDLGVRLGKQRNRMVYAATYAFSEEPRRAVLRLDSNGHNRAWLNGRLVNDGISGADGDRMFHDCADEVPIHLRAGWNRLLVQVENRQGEWMMVGQITDAAGRPIRDLTWQRERPDGTPH